MTRITFQDGKVVLRDGQVGTEEACCCGECVCIPCGDGFVADFTITGSNAGEFSRTVPYGFDAFGDSNGAVGELFGFTNLFCVDDEDFTWITLEIGVQEIFSGGTSQVFSVTITWICGSEYALDPGEWLVNLLAGMQTQALADIQNQPFGDTFLSVDYEKVYGPTDCTSEPVPFIDSNDMQGREGVIPSPCFFDDGAPPTEPDPCPFRVTARLRRV